jgi:hypothetical protein
MFSRDLVVYDGNSPVAEIVFRMMSGNADIRVGQASFLARRTAWLRSAYRLEQGDRVVCQAEQVGFWGRSYEVRAGSSMFSLRRQSGWFNSGWELADGDSVVGTLSRKGVFRATTEAEFSSSVDVVTQAFIVWLANVLWQQDQAAVAAAG